MSNEDNSIIEGISVDSFKLLLRKSELLVPFIEQNDKTPSWDGYVHVYKNARHKKADLEGRVPVQIKGVGKVYHKDYAKYSCDVSDLRNYYNDGGCLFLLICVDLNTKEAANMYYANLQVFDLKKLLDKAQNQETKTIELKMLPTKNTNELVSIFLNFLVDAKKQRGMVGRNILSLEELKKQGAEIESVSFHATGLGLDLSNVGKYISSSEIYLYAKPKNWDFEIPFEKVKNPIICKRINRAVIVGGKEYYDGYSVVYHDGQPTIKMGKAFTINIDEKNKHIQLDFKPQGTLSDYIRDIECYIDIVEKKELLLNGAKLSFEQLEDSDVEIYKSRLAYCKDVKRMLEILDVNEELQCDHLSENDQNNIRNFVNALVYGRRIGFPKMKESQFHGAFKIANLSIWIWATQTDEHNYHIESFFDEHKIVISNEVDGEKPENPIPASQYLLLNRDAYCHASNIDYEKIRGALHSMDHHPELINAVTYALLEILHGYDKQKNKINKTLELALEYVNWLAEFDKEVDEQVLLLNRLQIIKRQRSLTRQEIVELSNLAEGETKDDLRCGAYLLLDELTEAQKCFDKMPQDVQTEFLTYPICVFGNLKGQDK